MYYDWWCISYILCICDSVRRWKCLVRVVWLFRKRPVRRELRFHMFRAVYVSYTSWYRSTRYNRPYELVLCGQFPCRSTCLNKILYRVCKACVCVCVEIVLKGCALKFWSLKFLSIFDVFVVIIMIGVFAPLLAVRTAFELKSAVICS